MTKLTQRLLAVLVFTCALLPARSFAASHTWSGAVNGNFSTAGNWSAGGVPTLAETNILVFPAGATRFTITNNIGALKVSAFNFSGGGYIVRGASAFTIEPNLINLTSSGGSNTIESPLSFAASAAITVNSPNVLVLAGALSGTNALIKFGSGNLFFRGTASSPFSGALTVFSGELHFQKTGVASPYSGNSISIGSSDVGDPTQLFLYANDQIPDGADLNINPSGALILNGFSDTVDSVTMQSGYVDTGAGKLGISTGLFLTPRFVAGTPPNPNIYESPTIYGTLEFYGSASTIYVSNAVCNIDASIVENGTVTALNKTGAGTLRLKSASTFTGPLNIQQGAVQADLNNSLGSMAGATVVSSGASLIISSGVGTAEPLVLSGLGTDGQGALKLGGGTATCSGLITLGSEAGIGVPSINDTLNLDGPISGGGGLRKFGDGTLILNGFGNNTFSGASFVAKGQLTLNKSANVRAIGSVTVTNGASLVFNNHELMDNAGVLSIYTGGNVNLLNRNETIGGLNLGGSNVLNTGTGTLTMLGNFYTGSPYSVIHTPATILGNLSLGGATRTVLSNNYDNALVFDCAISDGSGTGGLRADLVFFSLLRSNSFTGPVLLNSAYCSISNSFAFGASGGGVISTNAGSASAIIFLHATAAVSGETLTVGNNLFVRANVSNAWNNPIVLTNGGQLLSDPFTSADATFTVNGKISGNGNVWADSGTLRLTQSNDYSGISGAAGGTLAITHPNALGATNQGTTIYQGSTLRLELPNGAVVNGEPLSFLIFDPTPVTNDSLTVVGAVSNTWSGPITMDGLPVRVDVLDFSGTLNLPVAIGGYGALEKTGPGTLILAGTNANTYPGDTVVNDGTLVLNKPNGVQATANLTVNYPAHVTWAGSEQIADAARLTLRYAFNSLGTNSETITQLALLAAGFYESFGKLTLLGDVDVDGFGPFTDSYLGCPLRLSAGNHLVSNTNAVFPAGLSLGPVHDLTTNGGLTLSNLNVVMGSGATNTFSGPVDLQASRLTMLNRHSLGSPAQGVTMDQSSTLSLDLPHGQVVTGESLTAYYNTNNPSFETAAFGSLSGFSATNGWSGPVTMLANLKLVGGADWGLDLSGPVSGNVFVDMFSDLYGTLLLTGTNSNPLTYLHVRQGQVRLAKTGGASAVGFYLSATTTGGSAPEIHVDAPGQFPPGAAIDMNGASLFLHDHSSRISYLRGIVNYCSIYGGANPATSLTISNGLGGFDSDYTGDFNGTLIKQGAVTMDLKGSFQNGDLFVEGGVLNRTCSGVVGQTVIAPGAVVNSSGPQSFNFGALSGAGTLNISGVNTWVGGGISSTFNGSIIGTNAGTTLTKVASGALTLAGPVALASTLFVQNGTLLANTTINSPIQVTPLAPGNTPTLGGTGQLQNVTLTGVGARIAPGATTASPSYGRLRLNNLTFGAGTSYRCEIGGTNAGANLDQIEASGTVTLASANLEAVTSGTGAISNRYAIVKSTPAIGGIFTGQSEGSTFFPSAGRSMQITYVGGTSGHDIVLMDLSAIPPGSFNGVQVLPNGTVQLGGTGTPSALYTVEANANLNTTNWLVIGTALANFNGAFSFVDTNAPSFSMRYYRFLLP